MRFGNCIGINDYAKIKIMAEAGFDYVELPVASAYNAPQADIDRFADELEKYNLKCEAVNFLFAGGIKLTGEEANPKEIRDYLSTLFSKTKNFGYEIVVLGSGGARKISENFPKERAIGQIVSLCRDILCEFAEQYNFSIGIEELNYDETNIINLVSEAKTVADMVNHPRCKILLDFYHIALNKDDISSMASLGADIIHTHIANPHKRYYPFSNDNTDYKIFFEALKKAGYNARMSIEGNIQHDFQQDSIHSLEYLKQIWEQPNR